MWNWIFALIILIVPCYFGVIQIRDWVAAARRGELKCPVRSVRASETRQQVNFAD